MLSQISLLEVVFWVGVKLTVDLRFLGSGPHLESAKGLPSKCVEAGKNGCVNRQAYQ